jgi:hypothetical protein
VLAGALVKTLQQGHQVSQVPAIEAVKPPQDARLDLLLNAGRQPFMYEQYLGRFVGHVLGRRDRLTMVTMLDSQATVFVSFFEQQPGPAIPPMGYTARWIGTPQRMRPALLAVGFEVGALGHGTVEE